MTIKTSYLVSNVQTKIGSSTKNTSYTYDTKGNILSIVFSDTGKGIYYKYDDKNQLLREDNQPLNKTFSYQYDLCGNLTSVSIYSYTRATNISTLVPNESYTYVYANNQWGDLLTTLVHASSSGESTTVNLTYDAIGNPLTYYNGSNTFTFSWQNGRQLLCVQSGGSTVASYAYDQDGIRTSKVCGNTRYDYYFDGNRIVRELQTRVDNGNIIKDSRFVYDVRGNISSSTVYLYNSAGTSYTTYNFLFRTNIQGDVIGIYNSSGTCLADITYDAWGNFTYTSNTQGTEQTVASETPFRYRGYYYDTETGFYYLNSRYYDPQLKRFISADNIDVINASPTELTDKNLYAYCDNNPVMRTDDDGEFWLTLLSGALYGIASQFVSDCFNSIMSGTPSFSSVSTYVGAAVGGAVGAFLPEGVVKDVVSTAVSTTVTMTCDNIWYLASGKGEFHSEAEVAHNVLFDSVSAAATSAIFSKIELKNQTFDNAFKRTRNQAMNSGMKNLLNAGVSYIKKPIFDFLSLSQRRF